MGVFSSPSIPLDGLVFSIDAGNAKSYSGFGTNVNNLVNGNLAILNNGVSYSANFSGHFSFDGVNDYLDVPTISSISGDFTVGIWFYTTAASDIYYKRLMDFDYINGFWLGRNADTNTWGGGIKETSSPYGIYLPFNNGAWHYLVSIRSGSTHILYGDGILSTTSNTVSSGNLTSVNNLRIASEPGGLNQFFNGNVAQVHIYNRALSAAEVAQIYNATKDRYSYKADIVRNGLLFNYDLSSALSYRNPDTFIQSTVNSYPGTLLNGPTYNSNNGGYLSFDGTNDYINILPSAATFNYNRSSFTVGGWTYMTSLPVSYFGVILSKWNTGGGNDNEFILNTDDGNKFLFAVDFDDSLTPNAQTNDFVVSNTTIVANTWYYVVGTFENGNIKLYVNGILESSVSNILTTVKTNTNSSLDIGRFGTSFYSTGRRAVIHMYNRALTSTEILSNFNALRGRYGI